MAIPPLLHPYRMMCLGAMMLVVAGLVFSPVALAAPGMAGSPDLPAFDPRQFGQPLSLEAQEALSGEAHPLLLRAAWGAIGGAVSYAVHNPYRPTARWFAGGAVAVAGGALSGFTGAGTGLIRGTSRAVRWGRTWYRALQDLAKPNLISWAMSRADW